MGSMAVVLKPGHGVENPMAVVPQWHADEYPPMGSPIGVRDQINLWISTAGLETEWRDDTSNVILPDGVEAVSFQIHRDSVRAIWISRPTGELLDVVCRNGHPIGWRVFELDSETEYLLSDFI